MLNKAEEDQLRFDRFHADCVFVDIFSRFAEEEEFEKADQLTAVIEEARARVSGLEAAIDELKSHFDSHATAAALVVSSALNEALINEQVRKPHIIFRRLIGFLKLNMIRSMDPQLKTIYSSHVEKLERLQHESSEKLSRETTRIKQEENRLELQKNHADKEEEILDQETSMMEKTIKYDFYACVERWCDLCPMLGNRQMKNNEPKKLLLLK